MKPEMILQADVLDIIFENRNKEYGAYALRREYPQRLLRSLGGVLFILLATAAFVQWNGNDRKNNITVIPVADSIKLRIVEIPKQDPPPSTPPQTARASVIANPPPVIVPDHIETDTIPTINDLTNTNIGDKTIEGPPSDGNTVPVPNDQTGNGETNTQQPVVEEPRVLDVADVMPEFPGGISGWLRFLQKNLRHPGDPEDVGPSTKIVVHVKFVVNEDGSLSGLDIVQSGGKEFDREVLRVMNKSPKWLAGSNKGRKVKVFHRQPVVFVYQQEE